MHRVDGPDVAHAGRVGCVLTTIVCEYRLRTLTSVRRFSHPALDDIISTKRKQTPRQRRPSATKSSASKGKGAKAAALGGAAAAAVSNANRQQPPVVFPGRNAKGQGSKVIVSNLPADVTEAQVKVRLFPNPRNSSRRQSAPCAVR